MKKLYTVLLLGAVVASCGVTRRMESRAPLKVTPTPVDVVFDLATDPAVAQVNYMVEIPANYVTTRAQLCYEPMLTDGVHTYPLTKIYVNGRTFDKLERRYERLGGGKVTDYRNAMRVMGSNQPTVLKMSDRVPFQEWMAKSKLVVRTSFMACGHSEKMYTQTLAENIRVILPPPPPRRIVEVIPVPVPTPTIHKKEWTARLSYPVGSAAIVRTMGTNAKQMDEMKGFIKVLLDDKTINITNIIVTGVSSPDGSYALNDKLSKERATNVRNYLLESVTRLDKDMISVENIAEDWASLRDKVEASDASWRDAVLKVIDNSDEPDAKEAALRKMPTAYTYIKQHYLPSLRRVTCEVFYTDKE